MKIKFLTSLLITLISIVCFGHKAYSEQAAGAEFNVCIAQFPCHLKNGKLLPGFVKGPPCNFDAICNKFRQSPEFIKLKKKLQRQRRKEEKRRERVSPGR